MKKNISTVFSSGLCIGCGICEDVCKRGAIQIIRDEKINFPTVDESLCTECNLCLKVCPGKGVHIKKISSDLFNENKIKYDDYIGNHINCYSGYSNDNDIRFHCASGGMVSQFLIYLLEKKIIDGAVVVGLKKEAPLEPYAYIATSKEEVLAGKSSKYCVVSYETIINQIKQKNGKYVIVGLPCHIHGFRKYESVFEWFKDAVLGYFAIYCSANKNYLSQTYLLKRYRIQKFNIKKFAYRDDGCMGYLKAQQYNGDTIKIPMLKYYVNLRGFFTPFRCTLCIDHYGDLADVSFGDIHIGEYIKDKVGVNSIITRNPFFNTLLEDAAKEKVISLKEVSPTIVNTSQAYMFKHKKGPGIIAAFWLRRFLKKEIPKYDVELQGRLKFKYVIREIQNHIFRKIGLIPRLWFIIDFLDWITGGWNEDKQPN